MKKYKSIFKIQGPVLIAIGLSMYMVSLVALILGERGCSNIFAMSGTMVLIPGLLLWILIRPSDKELRARDGLFVVTLAWVLSSVAGAVPFMLTGAIPSFADAFFESASGFSTTGSTILTDIEILPKSVLFWRSFTHWLGGMGIVVFVMSLLPMLGISGQNAAFAETTGPVKGKITSKFSDTAKKLYKLYIAITLVEVLLLKIGRMSWLDAFIHAFGTVGTGGFSSYNSSIAYFDSVYITIVITIFMFICGINFNLFFSLKNHRIKEVFKDEELRFYAFLIIAVSVLVFADGAIHGAFKGERGIINSIFTTVSLTTTTGYAVSDFDLWPTFSKMLLLGLFFVGGCAGSTGGGIKCVRILLCFKMIKRSFAQKLHPNKIEKITLNDQEVSSETLTQVTAHMMTFIVVVAASTLIISIDGYDIISSLTAALTCIGNIGPGFAAVGPTCNFAGFSGIIKFFMGMLMIAGRLEIINMFTLFTRFYWNPDRV